MTNEFPDWVPAETREALKMNGWFVNRYGELEHAGGFMVLPEKRPGCLSFREPGNTTVYTTAEAWRRALAVPLSDSFEVSERIRRAMQAYEKRKQDLAAQHGMIPVSDALLSAAFDALSALIANRDHIHARDIIRSSDLPTYDAEFARLIEPIEQA